MATVIFDSEHKEESKEFSLLLALTTILSSSLNLKETLKEFFNVLHEQVFLIKGVLALMDPVTSQLKIEESYGFLESSSGKVELSKWEQIGMQALDSENALIISDLGQAVEVFGDLDRCDVGEESFICIPIILGEEKIGFLSIDLPYENETVFYKNLKLFSIISLMIGQEIKLKKLLEREKKALRRENLLLKGELKEKYNIQNMIGKSKEMIFVYESINQVSNSNATVLITGESGTGKELVAHSIHYNSTRSKGPFVKVNCGAIPENLIESELFGHEKGAFTDAYEQRIGLFEVAHEGTIFLDEIGELSLSMQVKLLRVLQDKEITRVGSVTPKKINIRVIAATNKNLETAMEENEFREDLFYRLNIFPILVPSLRERRTDIMLLAEHFLEQFSLENNKKIKHISSAAADLLTEYDWPGNVRELVNCMERVSIICQSDTVLLSHLPQKIQQTQRLDKAVELQGRSFKAMVELYEEKIISEALAQCSGNCSKAARHLQTTNRVLSYKMKKFGLEKKKIKG